MSQRAKIMLTQKHLDKFCLPYGGDQKCRYLAEDENCYCCLKQSPLKKQVDQRVREHLKKLATSNTSKNVPTSTHALGNNCPGFPVLKTIPQGYDV